MRTISRVRPLAAFLVLAALALAVASGARPEGPRAKRSSPLPDDAVAWSAVGRTVALDRGGRIEVRDLDGALLFETPGGAPALSSGGRYLLANGSVVHDVARHRAYPLPGSPRGEARLSPARDEIALVLEVGGVADLYLVELRADEPRLHRLTTGGGACPRWIGRGRLLYERPRRDGGFGLYVREGGGLGPEHAFWDEPLGDDSVPMPAVRA